jgi:hypothetical protein
MASGCDDALGYDTKSKQINGIVLNSCFEPKETIQSENEACGMGKKHLQIYIW